MGILYGIVGVILGIIILLVIIYIILVIKLRQFGFKGIKLSDIKDEVKELEDDEPRQVSGMTNIFLPQILNDIKDFNLEEMFFLTEKSIRTILNAIENKNISILNNKDLNLINKNLKLHLEDLINSDILYSYDDICFHKHAIKDYKYNKGIATIEIVSSLEYYYKKEVNNKIESKHNNKKHQALYTTKYVYIFDNEAYKKEINIYGLNCPNCGAVVNSLKAKTCSYCKSGLNIQVVDLLKCWKLIECKDN